MKHTLTLGSLLLTDSLPDIDHGFVLNVLAEGLSPGVAKGVQEVVRTLLADGDKVRITRYGNREVTFRVEIKGPSLDAAAQGEAALRREVGGPNLLTWQPSDEDSAASVFEVIESEMAPIFDDLNEAMRQTRVFEVTLICAPFVRSAELTTVNAIAPGSTTVTFDTCDSDANWTGTRNGVATTSEGPWSGWEAGAVGLMELDNATGFAPEKWTLTRNGSVDFSTTKYLEVEITTLDAKAGAPLAVTAHINGAYSPLPALQVRRLTDGSGYYRVTYNTSGVAASSITFKHTSAPGYGFTWQGISVRNMARTNVSPNVTARQHTRIITPGGTERTPASIHVESTTGTDGLGGLVMVHTCPEDGTGYSPSLRQYRAAESAGTPVAAADTVSGFWEDISSSAGGFGSRVQTSALAEGGYVLMARVKATGIHSDQATLNWSTATNLGASTEQFGYINGPVKIPVTTTPQLVPVAALTLPSVRTRAGKVEVSLQVTGAPPGIQILLDDGWLFRADDDCSLHIVANFQNNLWLDSPDVNSDVPLVWIGPDRATANHPATALVAMGNVILSPQGTKVTTIALSNNPATSATFYDRFHSNVAKKRSA